MPVVDVDASLAGDSSLASEGSVLYSATASPAGDSSLAANLAALWGVLSVSQGSSTLTGSALGIKPLDSALSGSSTFDATSLQTVLYAALVGSSDLTAAAKVVFQMQAALAGGSGFTSFLNVVTGPVAPVRYSVPSRRVDSSKLVFDQVDLFLIDGKTRAQDVTPADLALRIYLNGTQLNWPLVSGAGVPDVRVAAGKVYWTEFSTGFYSIRFFPNAVGEWRVLLTYPAFDQAVSLGYDVVPQAGLPGGLGLRSSFVRRSP